MANPEGFIPDGFEPDAPEAIPQAEARQPSTNTALTAAVTSALAPKFEQMLMELATNPNVPKKAAAVGRVVGGVAPVVGGAMHSGPLGAAIGTAGAAQGAWAGGKTGWFTGKLAQNVSGYLAKIAEEVAPYLEHLQPLVGAQGALDLAQMAEPERQDIGTLGIGRNAHAGLDEAWSTMRTLIQQGATPQQAAMQAAGENRSLYPTLMTVYGKDARKGR